MKKKLLLLSLALLGSVIPAQTIKNADFEYWNSLSYNEPQNWFSSNRESIKNCGTITTTTVNGFSGKAAHMQTTINSTDTCFGYVVNGTGMGDPIGGEGGLPYSQKPSNITGYYRYNLPVNDTALMFVLFKKNGVILSTNWIKIRGTGTQSTFTSFTYSLAIATSTATPDSVIIAAASSNAMTNVGMQNGSWLELDQLSFTGSAITQTIQNGDFELWNPKTFDQLYDWSVAGGEITKIAGAQSGVSAVSFTTQSEGTNYWPTGITTGTFPQQGGPPYGGRPYTTQNDTLFGYYKFVGSTQDSGVIYVNIKKNGANICSGFRYFTNKSSWTLFKMPLSCGQTPDTMRVEIYSSVQPCTPASVGSVLSIDNLYLKSQPASIIEFTSGMIGNVYPNPANKNITVKLDGNLKGGQEINLFDMNGRKVISQKISSNQSDVTIDIQHLDAGLYYYLIENSEGLIKNKFVKE